MDDDLLKALGAFLDPNGGGGESKDATGAMAALMSETVKFRDELLAKTGYTLTVGDTRAALSALDTVMHSQPAPDDLSDVQRQLLEAWLQRFRDFGFGDKPSGNG